MQRTNRQSPKVHNERNMLVELFLPVIIVCGYGQTLVATTNPSPTAVHATTKSQLASKLQAIEKRYINKTVDLSEIQRYTSALYRNYTHDMQKSIRYFQKLFGPHIRNGTIAKRKLRNCSVHYKVKNMGRGSFPRRVKIGSCSTSQCSLRDIKCTCEPTKVAFKRITSKHCQNKRGRRRPKSRSGRRRRKLRKTRRCIWWTGVELSVEECQCKCQNDLH